MFETEVVRANECESQRRVRRHNRDISSVFFIFNMKVYCVISLEPHMSEQNIPFSI